MEGLALDMRLLKENKYAFKLFNLKTDALEKMDRLKLLQLNFVQLSGSYQNFSEDLRWLCWLGFHLKTIPSDLFMGNLVALDMSYSTLEVFEPHMALQSLKILNLKDSYKLFEIRNMYMIPQLETLILWNCHSLVRVCKTMADLRSLALLNMTGCKSFWARINLLIRVEAFGGRVAEQPNFSFLPHSLQQLFLKDCNLECNDAFPLKFSVQPSIQYLNLGNGLFEFLPCYDHLKNLRVLDLSLCSRLKQLIFLPSTLAEFGVDLMYNPKVFGKPEVDKVGIWLSYWPIGSTLHTGDKVNVSIVVLSGLKVHACGVSLVYADDEVASETLESNMDWVEVLGREFSSFQLSTGAYYLCRRDFFELMEVGRLIPDWLRILVGDVIDYAEVRGWRKTGRPKQLNPSFTELKTVRCIIHGPELEDIYKITEMSKLSLVDITSSRLGETMKSATSSKSLDTPKREAIYNIVEMSKSSSEDKNIGRLGETTTGATSSKFGDTTIKVFDGHGGKEASDFVRDNLPGIMVADADFPLELEKVVTRSFMETDAAFARSYALESTLSSGTTALAALIFGRSLLVANAGNSRTVLSRNGRALDMSNDHTPIYNKERIRVESLGGSVEDGYLNGQLAVTRAIGNWDMKGLKEMGDHISPLIAEPELKLITLTKEDEFLILGSDGIWDAISSQNAVDFVRRQLQQHNDINRCCMELAKEALRRGSFDNLTVVIVCFQLEPPPQVVAQRRTTVNRPISAEDLLKL
ncbi:unnamed protein product [Lactuca virosa]|uniref:PPM-type phosphatase domain-containing protein n=1 Tax=Lactuca virosa TaxID=75947 RepID=A0AAU9PFP4_9ASTR|nr:unnamed protein product [Lactuca virosa]